MLTDPTSTEPAVASAAVESEPSLAKNTLWSIGAEGIRLMSSVITFVILTRLYEPREFGVLVATMGLYAFVFPQASVGAGWLLIKRVTNDAWSLEQALARATGMVIVGGLVFGLGMMMIRPVLLPQASVLLFAGLAVSELLIVGMVEITLFAAQASEKLVVKTVVWSIYGIGRAAAALLLLAFVEDPDLGPWIVASTVISAAVLAVAQVMTVGRMVPPVPPRWVDFRQGLPYSIGFGADRVREVSDTVILVRVGYETDAGLYSAARRLVNVTQAPIIASLHAVNARLWRAGAESAGGARKIAIRFSGLGAVYGLVVAVGLIAIGGPVAAVLSDSYDETGTVLAWMSPIPLLLALETFAAMALTASGYHRHRTVLTLLAGAGNLLLNLALIPDHGWRGAVISSLVTSSILVLALWSTLQWAVLRDRRVGKQAR